MLQDASSCENMPRVECSLVPAKKELVAKKEIKAGVIGNSAGVKLKF